MKPPINGLPIVQAAKALKKDLSTVQKWIARGAPTVRPGSPGRGKGAVVNLKDLLRWRAGDFAQDDHEEILERLAVAMWDTFLRDDLAGRIGITKKESAGALILMFERFYKNLKHGPVPELEKLPETMRKLFHVWLE